VSRAHRPIWGSTDHPNIVRALGGLPGYPTSEAEGIDGAGQVVGYSFDRFAVYATEWSGGSVINLGGLPGDHVESVAYGINDFGQVVGYSLLVVPEPSTWAMMLAGFAGLRYVGYRRRGAFRAH
jgi:uncharacterized membrane protein